MLNQLISSKGMGQWRLDKTSQQDVRLWKPDTEVMDSRLEGFSARPKLLQYLCSNFTLIATSDITKAASNSTLQRVSPCGNYTDSWCSRPGLLCHTHVKEGHEDQAGDGTQGSVQPSHITQPDIVHIVCRSHGPWKMDKCPCLSGENVIARLLNGTLRVSPFFGKTP
jgi:hypothetical protein